MEKKAAKNKKTVNISGQIEQVGDGENEQMW